MRKAFFALFVCACSGVGRGQHQTLEPSTGHPISYSNMHAVEEEGDYVGWDVRVTKVADQNEITLFCGEGEVQGPVRAIFRLIDAGAVIHPTEKTCGASIELKFQARGIAIRAGDGEFEFVPQHKNFIKEERWR